MYSNNYREQAIAEIKANPTEITTFNGAPFIWYVGGTVNNSYECSATSGTINIKPFFPNNYHDLTKYDFICASLGATGWSSTSMNTVSANTWDYDPDRGVLSYTVGWGRSGSGGAVGFVSQTGTYLIYLGTVGSSELQVLN